MSGRRELFYSVIFLFCIGILYYSLFYLNGKEYYPVSLAIMIAGVILFLLRFEDRRPSVSELTIVAVLCAVAVTARVSFAFLPQVTPMAAVVIIAGISLGAETGFVVGALSAFVSNFYFAQGSWTPFQMFALGMVGFFAGVLFRLLPVSRMFLTVYSLLSVLVLYGGIVDLNTLFFYVGENTKQAVLAVYGAALPFNLIFAVSTAGFVLILHKPVLKKLRRIQVKYNLIDKPEQQ